MGRTAVAFIVVPLWVPVVMIGDMLRQETLLLTPVAVCTLLAYGVVSLLGVPTFLTCRVLKWTSAWAAIASGGAVAALIPLVGMFIGAVRRPLLHVGISSDLSAFVGGGFVLLVFGLFAMLGAITGGLVWLIARPDLQGKR